MDGHFLFVCKPTSHPTLQEYLTGVELPALTNEVKHGRQKFTYSDQWLGDVPLRDGPDALAVNWRIIEIRNRSARLLIATVASAICRSTLTPSSSWQPAGELVGK
jgi:hypothetical protein